MFEIIAVIVAPILAVLIGQYLQNRDEKRKDKLSIFKILMTNRLGWSYESVYALNIIDIAFADSDDVCTKWAEYYKFLCIQKPDEMQLKQRQEAQDKLLEAMAKDLGYKNRITWDKIQNPYIPQGMVDAMQQRQVIQNGQVEFAKVAGMFSQMVSNNEAFQQPKQQGDKPDADT